MKTVRVDLGERAYSIYIGPGSCSMLQKCNDRGLSSRQWVVVADQTVADLHLEQLKIYLPAEPLTLTFPAGESSKSLATAERVYARLSESRIERGAIIVTFGGGVAGDLGGFVAATWLRGVRFLQVPTTLLAAIDASVGGKTGVNLPAGKNLVGVFHQPSSVIVDTDFLETLSAREFTAGLAESVKHALVRDPQFFGWHEVHAEALSARDSLVVSDLIARNCEIKAEVVARDERETGLRAILNYGHTIGHAIEHLLDYELRHGECVALGMLVENELGCARGILGRAAADRIRGLLERLGLPARLPRRLDLAEVAATCRLDKKVRDGGINVVLVREIGEPQRVPDVSEAEIAAALQVVAPV